MSQLVTPQGIAAQAEFDATVVLARIELHRLLGLGCLTFSPMLSKMDSAGFSEQVAREAMWRLIDADIIVVRADRSLALAAPRFLHPAREPGPPDHAEAIAAALSFEKAEGYSAYNGKSAGYWPKLMKAVAPHFAAEADERARRELVAAGWRPPTAPGIAPTR